MLVRLRFFLSGLSRGQGTLEKVPDSDANQNAPALHGPNSNQVAQVGEIEVLNGPVGFHIRNYLGFGVLANIRVNWQRALNEKGIIPTGDQKEFAVEFTFLKDGTLDSRKVVESSGDPELDRTGLDAVAKSAPFTAIPAGFSGEFLKVRCRFYLNPGRRIRSVSRPEQGGGWIASADNTPGPGERHHPRKRPGNEAQRDLCAQSAVYRSGEESQSAGDDCAGGGGDCKRRRG
jgi:TonB family protein